MMQDVKADDFENGSVSMGRHGMHPARTKVGKGRSRQGPWRATIHARRICRLPALGKYRPSLAI